MADIVDIVVDLIGQKTLGEFPPALASFLTFIYSRGNNSGAKHDQSPTTCVHRVLTNQQQSRISLESVQHLGVKPSQATIY